MRFMLASLQSKDDDHSMSDANKEIQLDVGPGKPWLECTTDQKLNRMLIVLTQLSQRLDNTQELLITHGHELIPTASPVDSSESQAGIPKKEGGSE
jgi:hypothetical protein